MTLRRLLLALFCGFLPALVSAVPQRALVNLSARAPAGASGAGALSSSFTIEGSVSKTVLIRAVGPKLASFSVTGFMADPALVVFDGAGQRVAENDNWGSAAASPAIVSASTALGAFALDDNSKDAALVTAVTEADAAVVRAYRDGPTVVVTHFAPSLRSADPRYGLTPGTAGFCNALDPLLAHADLWLHGHLHCRHDYRVGRCRVVANPMGYASKGEQADFDPGGCVLLPPVPAHGARA